MPPFHLFSCGMRTLPTLILVNNYPLDASRDAQYRILLF